MTDGNPLVDQDAKFEWGDYIPGTESSDQGGTSKWNPFTPGQGHTTGRDSWYKGIPVVDTARQLRDDVNNDDLFNGILDYATAGLEIAGLGMALTSGDWGGLIVAPVASWLMEHLKPLRLILDELTGNMDAVHGVAQTWHNLSDAMFDASARYFDAVEELRGGWAGEAASAYEKNRADPLHVALEVAGILTQAWGDLVKIAGDCVGVTHDTVRDLIAALQGQLVQDLTEALTVVGALAIPAQTLGEIERVTTQVLAKVDELVKALYHGVDLAKAIVTMVSLVVSAVREFGERQ